MIKNIIFILTVCLSTNVFSQNENQKDSGLKFLTTFQDSTKVTDTKKQDNPTEKILFSIRKYITINEEYFKDNISKYGLDDLSSSDTKTILKYQYLEKEIKFTKQMEDLLPSMDSKYSAEYYKLVKEYDNVSAEEIAYKSLIYFSDLENNNKPFEFILDKNFKVLRGSQRHYF